jgi:Protein of unknown function (DUF3048) N-terminal domain/Protein of unknown function (DUF3048) C-terminal domain
MVLVVDRRAAVTVTLLPLLAACGSSAGSGPTATASPGMAPALVQVENNSAARPQWGLQQAAVVYEYLTEGGITRFSALYTTPPSTRVGPVRSARLVTIHLAEIYGAVVVYSGASTAVQQALDQSHVPHVDENSAHGDLFRVGGRAAPHNLASDGDHLRDLLQRYGARVSLPPTLWARSNTAPATGGRDMARFSVPLSDSERPVFSWDAGARAWKRSEPDTGPFVDADSHAPVTAATVIVQQVSRVDSGEVEDVNGAHGLDHVISGSGAAQVFTGGREYDATWTQARTGPPSFTLTGGGAAPIAPGLVWICLVATGSTAG